jgi:hypothetical protein
MLDKDLKKFINAKIVYLGPSGFSGKLSSECLLLKQFIEENNNAEELLKNALKSAEPMVVCYGLVGLSWIGSAELNNLPIDIVNSTYEIIWQFGSVRSHGTVGEFAKLMADRSNKEKPKEQTFAQKQLDKYLERYTGKKS